MTYLLLSILSSTLIYVVFKLFPRYGVQTLQAIVFNYWMAFLFGLSLVDMSQISAYPSYEWKWLVPIEGVLFIAIFNVMALTVQKHSVTVGSVASRTAMIIPAGVFMFLEPENAFSIYKVIGIILACLAVYLSSKRDKQHEIDKRYFYLPLILFIGSGTIDLLIGYAETHLMQSSDEILMFTPGIFLIAGLIGTAILIYRYRVTKDIKWQWKDVIGGMILGLINYSSLYFILKAMNSKLLDPAIFFPVNHMGIIAAGILVGLIAFKERISVVNWVGIGLGLVAILLMTWVN